MTDDQNEEHTPMTIALSHGGTTVYSSPAQSMEVLVGTTEGVATIARDGAGWQVAHRGLPDCHISAMIEEPTSGLLLAAAFHGGIHASADGGRTWERRTSGLREDNVYSLAACQRAGRPVLYAGTEPAHLFRSDDLGGTWTELPALRSVPSVESWTFPAPPHIGHVKHLVFDPQDNRTMYASIEVGGLLKSRDGGDTWSELPIPYEDVHRLVIQPRTPEVLYVAAGNGLYVSPDGGATWDRWTDRTHEMGGYPDFWLYRPTDPDLMFISAAQSPPGTWRQSHFAGARISRSHDGGRTWQLLHEGLPDRLQASIEAMCLEESEAGCALFAATTAGEVWHSPDAGDHWSLIVTGLPPVSKGGHNRPLMVATA
jgi:photosystem II stability/assembly factor-like uncharacterized protein